MLLMFLFGVFYLMYLLLFVWCEVLCFNLFFYMIDGFCFGFFGVFDINLFVSFVIVIGFFVLFVLIVMWLFVIGYKLCY